VTLLEHSSFLLKIFYHGLIFLLWDSTLNSDMNKKMHNNNNALSAAVALFSPQENQNLNPSNLNPRTSAELSTQTTKIFGNRCKKKTVYQKAVRFGCFNVLKYAYQHDKGATWDVFPSVNAARFGRQDILQWIKDSNLLYSQNLLAHAAERGHFSLLIWLRANFPDLRGNAETAQFAARSADLDILQWIYNEKIGTFDRSGIIEGAASSGNLPMVKWLRSLDPPCPWDEIFLCRVIQARQFDMLKWAVEQNPPPPMTDLVFGDAVRSGRIEYMKFLRDLKPPCPWSEESCVDAARTGNLDTL